MARKNSEKTPKRRVRKSNRYKKKRLYKRRVALLLIFLILIIYVIFYTIGIFFKIKEIDIQGVTMYDANEIISGISIDYNDSLIFFDKNNIKKEILEKFPYIESVTIRRNYPAKLNIQVVENDGEYTIYYEGTHYEVQEKGKVLAKKVYQDIEDKIKIIGFEPVSVEISQKLVSKNDYKTESLYKIIEYFKEYEYIDMVTEIDLTKTYDIKIKCGVKYEIKIGNISDIDHKMKMLDEVLKKLTPSDTAVIDLSDKSTARFRNEEIFESIYP